MGTGGASFGGEVLARGEPVGAFVVEQAIARAGFSTVYRARDPVTGRLVAVKVLHGHLARSPRGIERFRREAAALEKVRHPNIVQILDYGELPDGRPYIVMEWLEGASLRDLVRSGALTLDEALPIVRQLGAALSASHAAGILHRDLKSNNVMVLGSAGGAPRVKLVDFGLSQPTDVEEAKKSSLTSTGRCMGTPHAMAPEQIYGLALDERVDVYGVGVLFYELLTGQKPFRSQASADLIDMHLHAPPPRASDVAPVPPAVDGVIQRCLAKRREERFDSVEGAVAALERAADGSAADPRPSGQEQVDGIGLYFEVQVEGDEDELDDDGFDAIEELLAAACTTCEEAGMRIALLSGNSVLAVALLPGPGPRRVQLRHRVLETARTLREALDGERDRACRVQGAIRVHLAPIRVGFSGGAIDLLGGELLDIGSWAATAEPGRVIVSAPALEGLEERFLGEPVSGDTERRRLL